MKCGCRVGAQRVYKFPLCPQRKKFPTFFLLLQTPTHLKSTSQVGDHGRTKSTGAAVAIQPQLDVERFQLFSQNPPPAAAAAGSYRKGACVCASVRTQPFPAAYRTWTTVRKVRWSEKRQVRISFSKYYSSTSLQITPKISQIRRHICSYMLIC